MPEFLKHYYGDCEGPLGIPCLDRQAQALESVLRSLPSDDLHAPGHLVVEKATTELLPGERADVSWISSEDPDRVGDVVLAAGMNDEHFKLNPVVTLQHAYHLPPVGRSLWRRRARDGDRRGIKAKTLYPPRPEAWPAGSTWPPDFAFPLVQSGLLCGKSIGFLPTKVRPPTDEERERWPTLRQVRRIIEEWVLLEYACVYLPAQQNAVVESVAKRFDVPPDLRELLRLPSPSPVPFTSLSEVEHHVTRRLEALDFASLAESAVRRACDRLRGRV
jgi:hypothetical protein